MLDIWWVMLKRAFCLVFTLVCTFIKGDINTVGVVMFTLLLSRHRASTVTVSYWLQCGRMVMIYSTQCTKETKPEIKPNNLRKPLRCCLTRIPTTILRENMDVPELLCSLQPRPFVLSVLTIEWLQRAWVNSL